MLPRFLRRKIEQDAVIADALERIVSCMEKRAGVPPWAEAMPAAIAAAPDERTSLAKFMRLKNAQDGTSANVLADLASSMEESLGMPREPALANPPRTIRGFLSFKNHYDERFMRVIFRIAHVVREIEYRRFMGAG